MPIRRTVAKSREAARMARPSVERFRKNTRARDGQAGDDQFHDLQRRHRERPEEPHLVQAIEDRDRLRLRRNQQHEQVLHDDADAEGRQQSRRRRRIADRTERHALEGDRRQRRRRDGKQNRDDWRRQPQRRRQEHAVGRNADDLAMGEVHQPHDRKHHRQAKRHQRIFRTEGKGV
jgi:hypothetical protein